MNMIPLHFFQPCRPSKVPFANLQCASCAAWDQIRKRHVDEGPEHHPKVWSQPSNCGWLRNPAPVGSLSRYILLFIGFYTNRSFVFATPWSLNMCLFCCTFFKGDCHPTCLFGHCCLAVCCHSLRCAACACNISQCPIRFCLEDHSSW